MSDRSFLASASMTTHLVRGAIGTAMLVVAMYLADGHPWPAFAFGVLALVAFRGCPLCWTLGFIEVVYRALRGDA